MASRCTDFRTRLRARDPMVGTWVKTPSPIVSEVLAMTDLDVLCLDAEHAPFDRSVLDTCVFSLRAADMPSLVRIPSGSSEHILNALDIGATGIVVPHVRTAQEAANIVTLAHFGPGGRGYAGSTRAAGYTRKPMPAYRQSAARTTTVIAQVEDVEALDAIADIASVEGLDCVFIGRIDLTVALGADSPDAPVVISAVEEICRACAVSGCAVGMFLSSLDELPTWFDRGARFFLLASDHTFLSSGAGGLAERFRKAAVPAP